MVKKWIFLDAPRMGCPAAELLVNQQRNPLFAGRPARVVGQQGSEIRHFARPGP